MLSPFVIRLISAVFYSSLLAPLIAVPRRRTFWWRSAESIATTPGTTEPEPITARNRWPVVSLLGWISLLVYFQVAQHFFATVGLVYVYPQLPLNAGSSLYFPATIAICLTVYLRASWTQYLAAVFAAIATNLLLAVGTILIRWGWWDVSSYIEAVSTLWGIQVTAKVWSYTSTLKILCGTSLLAADAVLLPRLVQWSIRATQGWRCYALPLLLVLFIDSLGYSLIILLVDRVEYAGVFAGQLLGKLPVGLFYGWSVWQRWPSRSGGIVANVSPSEFGPAVGNSANSTAGTIGRPSFALSGSSNVSTPAHGCMLPSLEIAQQRFQDALPHLLVSHVDWWVVFGNCGEQLYLTNDFGKLETWLARTTLTPGTYIIRQIVPWLLNSQSNSIDENCQIVMCE